MTITPEGEKVANYAKEMLQREEDIKSELAVFRTETHGTLKIAVASVIGQYWLPPVLKKFVHKYPSVKISLFTGWSSEVQKQFYEGDVHVAILRGTQEYKGQKQQLFEDELYLVDKEIKDISMLKKQIGRSFNLKVIRLIMDKYKIGGMVYFLIRLSERL